MLNRYRECTLAYLFWDSASGCGYRKTSSEWRTRSERVEAVGARWAPSRRLFGSHFRASGKYWKKEKRKEDTGKDGQPDIGSQADR